MQQLTVTGGSDITSHMATNQHGTSVDTTSDRPNYFLAPQHQLLPTSETKYAPLGPKIGPRWKRNLLSIGRWTQNSICGNIAIYSRHNRLHLASPDETTAWIEKETHSETRTSVIIRPAKWLSMLGIEAGLMLDLTSSSISIRGWKHTLSSFRVVPDDALIFDLCRQGNLGAVQLLLSRGEASVKDTNSDGRQPLHVSWNFRIAGLSLELILFLDCC